MKFLLLAVVTMMSTVFFSCSSIVYVDFEDSSTLCKSTREIVNIPSKMIPSDEELDARYKTAKRFGELQFGEPEINEENSKILDDGENFITRPEGQFFRTSVEEGKYVIYWIHYVSPDPNVLVLLSEDEKTVHESVNGVIQQVYSEGLFKTTQWENELNKRILDTLVKDPRLQNLTNVVVHMGC